jgi:hypothetical protein
MQKADEKANCEEKLRIKSRVNIFGVAISWFPIGALNCEPKNRNQKNY